MTAQDAYDFSLLLLYAVTLAVFIGALLGHLLFAFVGHVNYMAGRRVFRVFRRWSNTRLKRKGGN